MPDGIVQVADVIMTRPPVASSTRADGGCDQCPRHGRRGTRYAVMTVLITTSNQAAQLP